MLSLRAGGKVCSFYECLLCCFTTYFDRVVGRVRMCTKYSLPLIHLFFFFLTGLTLPSSSRKDNRPRHCTSAVRISAVLQQSPSVEGLALRASGSDFSKINIYLAISPLLQTINNVSLKPCLPLVWLMMLVKLLSAAV